MFKLREQVQGLQTVDPECFEKIIVGRKFFSRHSEVCRSKIQYLVQGLVGCLHNLWVLSPLSLRQIGLRVGTFYKLPQPGIDCWTSKQLAEQIDLSAQLLLWNGFDKFLGRGGRGSIEFLQLRRRGPSSAQ